MSAAGGKTAPLAWGELGEAGSVSDTSWREAMFLVGMSPGMCKRGADSPLRRSPPRGLLTSKMRQMGDRERIGEFLRAIRRRSLMRLALKRGAAGLAATLLALLLLAVAASSTGPAGFWIPLTVATLVCGVIATFAIGVVWPSRTLRSDRQAARVAGALVPPLGSDLVSAVELEATPRQDAESPTTAPPPGAAATTATTATTAVVPTATEPAGAAAEGISPALVRAFHAHVAAAVGPLDATRLLPVRPALPYLGALLAVMVVLIGGARLRPDVVGRGLGTLFHRPSRFEGAAVSAAPLVGDVRITYQFPPYTGLPDRTVEGSTGDLVAVKGTRVRLETMALGRVRQAAMLLGETGERGEIGARVAKGKITAELTLMESGVYRFWLRPLLGRAVREQRPHRMEAEVDRAPRVDIHAPADRLELPTPRPIEIGYAADDDYGLGAIELVFRVDDGPEQRQLLQDGHGARTAQSKTLWDPARLELLPGARIAYRIEARDRDTVSGAKVGSSRTLYVVIARPQESIDDRLDRQREVLERLIGDLGDRLETLDAGSRGALSPADLDSRRAAYATLHEAEETHLTVLGRLLDDDRHEQTLGKPLRAALAGIADRLGRLVREEKGILGPAQEGRDGELRARAIAAALGKLDAASARHIAELEKDVLMLDDLIGRQRLEDLASLGRELTDAHQRLKDLLERYKATKSEALRRQLEREVRELRSRIADLAQKIASLKARNDVPEEWRNLPDTTELAEQAKKLDELLSQGDANAMERALADLGKDLQGLQKMLNDNAEGFGAQRFPQENRVVADLMKRISDLEGDERTLAGETKALSEKQEAEIQKRVGQQMSDWIKKENEKVERLQQRLGELRTGDPESALSEEVERARDSVRQIKRLLGERDLAEAKSEADRAAESLDRATEHLEDGPRRKKKQEEARAAAAESVGNARGQAEEIANDIQAFLPRAEDMLSPAEREQAKGQSKRQSAIGDKTQETAEEAARRLGKTPGLEQAESELKAAAGDMREAAEHLEKSEAKQASGAQRSAADRLAKLRDSLQDRSLGSGQQQRDPVRIPGADESSAPRAWREELMDAMKEKAPEPFRDEVRRYYEELVR